MSTLYKATKPNADDRKYFQRIQEIAEQFSDDPDTPLGVLVVSAEGNVVAEGANSLPVGVLPDPLRLSRPCAETHPEGDNGKYDWLNHAERKAVCHAARDGNSLKGGRMYALLMPCIQCAQTLIDAGVTELVLSYDFTEAYRAKGSRWEFDFQRVITMLKEAGVTVRAVKL